MTSSIIAIKTKDEKEIYSLLYSNGKKNRIVVLIHGACMNYLTGISLFVPEMTSLYQEYDFLSVNTRAHDIGYIIDGYNEREGWAWQRLSNNLYDLEAVISYVHSCKYDEIVLCGHSWGGLICLDYIQNHVDEINNLILLSPTISYKLLLEVNYKGRILEVVERAKKLILENHPNHIIETNNKSPLPFMSAKTIDEFYNSSFEIGQVLEKISCKTHILIGSLEHKKLIEFANSMSQKNSNIQTCIVEGANHFYANNKEDVVNIIDTILGGKKNG